MSSAISFTLFEIWNSIFALLAISLITIIVTVVSTKI
jgi:hypothetical protein